MVIAKRPQIIKKFSGPDWNTIMKKQGNKNTKKSLNQ